MLKATLIDALTARMLDEAPCIVADANAIVENGKVVGVRATLRLARPLTIVRNDALVITGHAVEFDASMPAVPVVAPSVMQPDKPKEPIKP